MHSVAGSESGHESLVPSLLGRESLASSVKRSLDGGLSISERLSNFRVSMAYDSALHKKKCGLCQMYFDRHTVKYKVPNHRIFDLQRSWMQKNGEESKVEGKRYKSASYLYTDTTVCTFCSQFFWLLKDELNDKLQQTMKPVLLEAKGPKLDVVTEFERADVSQNKRAFQSSDVDQKYALYAISPPFDTVSKTRREVDPWWEVDLGRNFQLSKLSFKVTVHVRQEFTLYVMLLSKPFGFEDPFLDSICGKARETKQFHLEAQDRKRQVTLVWSLPPNSFCFGIRVQIKGIHILELQQFQAFLGDEVIMETEEDLKISALSFASLNPKTIREALKEVTPPQSEEILQKPKALPKDQEKIQRLSEDAVKILSERILSRYNTLGDWKSRVLEFSKMFTADEIESLYKVIFKYTAETNKNNQDSDFNEHDLLHSALLEHYPRCDLQDLHQRIRTVLRWIQTRSHLKVLGALLHCEVLNQMSINSNEVLYKFMSAIKRIEVYWNKKEEYEIMYAHLEHNNPKVLPIKTKEMRGCSWSQFLVLFSLFIQQRCDEIALHAFRIENPSVALPVGTGDDLISAQSYQTGDAMSVKSFDVSVPDKLKKRDQAMISSQSLIRLSTSTRPLTSQGILGKSNNRSYEDRLVTSVRKETGKVPFDSRMSEYKMDNLLRRMVRVDVEFPKELDLDFAKGLIPSRDSGLGVRNSWNGDELGGNNADIAAKDDNSHHSIDTASLSYDGVPLPSRPAPLQRGMTAKFQLIRSTSKLSKLLTDGTVEPPTSSTTPLGTKKHATFKSSRNLLSASAPSSATLLTTHNQRSTRSINTDDDGSHPAPPLSRNLPRSNTARDLAATANFGHNLTTVRESYHEDRDNSSQDNSGSFSLMRSPSKGNVLHQSSSSKHLQRASSTASVVSNGGDLRHSSPVRPATSFHPAGSSKNLSLNMPESSPLKGGSFKALHTPIAVSTPKDDMSENIDDLDFDEESRNRRRPSTQELKSIDFHRICALCELRLPRASVDFKVMRKHVVKLK